MFQIKPISRDSIPAALEKAERYRLLNEPILAESICLDILEADPNNRQALVTMLLAMTDQFGSSSTGLSAAKHILTRLPDEYERQYYSGLICERQGKAVLDRNNPDSGFVAYEWLRDAMDYYERAEAIRPPGKDDAILRWNTCIRMIAKYHLKPRDERFVEHPLE